MRDKCPKCNNKKLKTETICEECLLATLSNFRTNAKLLSKTEDFKTNSRRDRRIKLNSELNPILETEEIINDKLNIKKEKQMGTPIKCKLNKPLIYSGNTGDMRVEGSLDIIWNHRTGEPTDVVGFELFMYCGKDDMIFSTGENTPGINAVWLTVETLLKDKLINIAKENCEHEPPTDGTIQEQINYSKLLDDFYPPTPRG